MCKYNNYKFWDLTFFEGINKYSLRKLSANELAEVFYRLSVLQNYWEYIFVFILTQTDYWFKLKRKKVFYLLLRDNNSFKILYNSYTFQFVQSRIKTEKQF